MDGSGAGLLGCCRARQLERERVMTVNKAISQAIGQVLWPELIWLDTTEEQEALIEEREAQIKAILSALAEEGYVIVPMELDPKNMDHWKVASAGIRAIEEFGGELGSDHTPERQISDAYRYMIRAMISKAEQGEG